MHRVGSFHLHVFLAWSRNQSSVKPIHSWVVSISRLSFWYFGESERGLCDPMDCSLPRSSIHAIFQARVLEWVAISFSRGSSQPRDQTWVSRTVGSRFTIWATRGNWAESTCSNYFLSLPFLWFEDEKEMATPNLHSCFSLLFCLWTLRINSANGLEIKSTESQSSLTVTNVTEEHYGNYTCVAANNLGMTNASLVLFSKYANLLSGEPTQENQLEASPVENLKIIPLLLNISLCKTQSITTETKPQVLNPYQETKFTNGIPALSSPWLTCDNCLVSLSDFFSFSFPGWLNCKNIHWTKISLLMVSLTSLDDVRSWKVDGSLKMAGMGVIEEAVFREDG